MFGRGFCGLGDEVNAFYEGTAFFAVNAEDASGFFAVFTGENIDCVALFDM
jgi:hypothetical protein